MNMNKWIDKITSTKTKKAMPILSFPGAQLLDITLKDLVCSGKIQASCLKKIADRFDTLATVSFMDLSVEAEAFGCPISFYDDDIPTVKNAIIHNEGEARALKVPDIGSGRTGECIRAIKLASSFITDRPIFGGVIGPYSLAGRLMDMTEIMMKCLAEPQMTHEVLRKCTDFLLKYIQCLKDAGANGVVIAEPAAGLISPSMCEEFSSNYLKEITDKAQGEDFLIIYHNCGNTIPLVDAMLATGAKAYHFGNSIDIKAMLSLMPKDVLVMGNLDPTLFVHEEPDFIIEATKSMICDTTNNANYVVSSGCDIPYNASFENIDAFLKTTIKHSGS